MSSGGSPKKKKLNKKLYEEELHRLQEELVMLQDWIKQKGLKVCILFEGRDAAGKGGVIKRITQYMNPRFCHVVALGKPTDKEESQWYFQRYIPHLPAKGEMVIFDRSWYNCVGVDRVMNFTTADQWEEFFRSCPEFERMLVRSGIILLKYWFSVSPEQQLKRFKGRIEDPIKRWKISPMDLKSIERWDDYSRAKDEMFEHCHTEEAPWYEVPADNKKKARLNCIHHILSQIPYKEVKPVVIKLPERPEEKYKRPPLTKENFVPELY
ncbi:polyphosphate kinase 2 [Oceanispirochaeta crateris]|uniref:ADP/GDP-polyphosphate phosphotransferase n=1 Tax=Oceanispirochaeta crateris TaxID=2518645 RepID=A0A5C1QGT1_9SPIO|nr:polyphosphate kinase 2 [Oceanispirochaeta crateris]QEN06761.1 polyphosphate kinase 2 [Oceanispirochaeta crateris]